MNADEPMNEKKSFRTPEICKKKSGPNPNLTRPDEELPVCLLIGIKVKLVGADEQK